MHDVPAIAFRCRHRGAGDDSSGLEFRWSMRNVTTEFESWFAGSGPTEVGPYSSTPKSHTQDSQGIQTRTPGGQSWPGLFAAASPIGCSETLGDDILLGQERLCSLAG